MFIVPGGIRTPNLLIRSQLLYPVELQTHSWRKTHQIRGVRPLLQARIDLEGRASARYLFGEVFNLKPTSKAVLESEDVGGSRRTPNAERRTPNVERRTSNVE